jgi:survival of motor neuron protein-interacting protein 1
MSSLGLKPSLPVPKRKSDNNKKRHRRDEPISFGDIALLDASTYLSRVSQQASELPDIFEAASTISTSTQTVADKTSHGIVVVNKKKKYEEDPTVIGSAASALYLVSHRTSLRPPPSDRHVPIHGRRWVDAVLADFSKLREYLENCGCSKDRIRRILVPPMKDRVGWHVFCVGLDDASGNPGGYFDDDNNNNAEDDGGYDNNGDSGVSDEIPTWRLNLPPNGQSPTVSLILQLDQVMVRRVLSHLIHYVIDGDFPVTGKRGLWLYALLARLDRPIHRDDAVVLYSLLKKLTCLREQIPLSTDNAVAEGVGNEARAIENIACINTIIAIVGIYFEQGGGYAAVMGVLSK